MDVFDRTQLTLADAMHGAQLRQSALAGNLANVDTPGYVRKDVDFQGALRSALAAGRSPDAAAFAAAADTSAPIRLDGNSVDVDRESSSLAENGLTYQALAQVARTRIEILQSAMGVG